jgi:N-acetylmuramoyl-L-alanine amidase
VHHPSLPAILAAGCLLLAACASPSARPQPTVPTAPTGTPAPATSAPTAAPTPAETPTATPRLQSQQEGPETEQAVAAAPPAPTVAASAPVAPQPVETITPADQCDPNQLPPPLRPGTPGGFSAFRVPLPPTPQFDPPGSKRIGLQAGHWQNEQVPPELGRLQAGSSGGGRQEWEVTLDIARRAKTMLEADGYQVDLLPATVPIRYQAHVFVAVHADGDTAGALSGYKIARPGFSSVPGVDDQLVKDLYAAYGPITHLARDDEHISLRMTYYYAFNSRRYCHAVAPGVPQAIIETGFLTSASDRQLLIGNPDVPARGIAAGIRAFVESST